MKTESEDLINDPPTKFPRRWLGKVENQAFCLLVFRFYRTPLYPLPFHRFYTVLEENGTETSHEMQF